MELLGVDWLPIRLRMAYLCYHLPRRPTPDIVGWKDLVWAGREQRDRCRPALWGAFLEDWTASVCTTFVQHRAVQSSLALGGDKHDDADRLSAFIAFRALMLYCEYVEGVTCNLHVHTGRLKRKFCVCCAGRRKGVPSPVFLGCLQSQIYFRGKIA